MDTTCGDILDFGRNDGSYVCEQPLDHEQKHRQSGTVDGRTWAIEWGDRTP